MALSVICLKKCLWYYIFHDQNIFQNRGLDTNRKWSVSQNDQNVDTAFLLGADVLPSLINQFKW